jgi:hypothetical protein
MIHGALHEKFFSAASAGSSEAGERKIPFCLEFGVRF